MNLLFNVAQRFGLPVMAMVVLSLTSRAATSVDEVEPKPNILWLSTEDIGPQLNCYGDSTAKTPAIDALAKRGIVYDYAWSNYPVCAPARTTIITGMYASTCGAGNMRSMVKLPDGVDMFPVYLRKAGYYCTNNSKEDYNYVGYQKKPWDESSNKAHYRNREQGQPFFAVFNYTGTHESKIRVRPHEAVIDPAEVKLPAYWPDKREVRQDWAQYYDNIQTLDGWVQKHLRQLEKSGEADNTIVVFFGDHGSGMPRHKRYAGDSGMRVPFVVHVPGKLKYLLGDADQGVHSDRPVGFIDLAPTMLSVAGIKPKPYMHGTAFLGSHKKDAGEFLYGFRDRMDERFDCSRSIRNKRFVYIKNFYPNLPAGQELGYQMKTPTTAIWKRMFDAGELNEVQSAFWSKHPTEELYDLVSDPEETKNLAFDSDHAETLKLFRSELKRSHLKFGDLGLIPEVDLLALANENNASPRSAIQRSTETTSDMLPLEDIFDAAMTVSRQDADGKWTMPEARLAEYLKSTEPAVRYWGLMAILFRGQSAFTTHKELVVGLVEDEYVSVSIAATELLAAFGDQTQRTQSLEKLLYFCDYRNSNVIGAVTALNAIDRLGVKADPIRQQFESIPKMDPKYRRGKDYIKRMLEVVAE